MSGTMRPSVSPQGVMNQPPHEVSGRPSLQPGQIPQKPPFNNIPGQQMGYRFRGPPPGHFRPTDAQGSFRPPVPQPGGMIMSSSSNGASTPPVNHPMRMPHMTAGQPMNSNDLQHPPVNIGSSNVGTVSSGHGVTSSVQFVQPQMVPNMSNFPPTPTSSQINNTTPIINGPIPSEGVGPSFPPVSRNQTIRPPMMNAPRPTHPGTSNYGQVPPSFSQASQIPPLRPAGQSSPQFPGGVPPVASAAAGYSEKRHPSPVSHGQTPSIPVLTNGTASSTSSDKHHELPVPYHGQGQYSHQIGSLLTPSGLTPTNSEPTSRKSSRAPSPVTGSQVDALEGGGIPSHPGTDTPPFIGSSPVKPQLSEQENAAPSVGITGRRQYPEMNRYNSFPQTAPSQSRFPGPQPGIPANQPGMGYQPNFPMPASTSSATGPASVPPVPTQPIQPYMTGPPTGPQMTGLARPPTGVSMGMSMPGPPTGVPFSTPPTTSMPGPPTGPPRMMSPPSGPPTGPPVGTAMPGPPTSLPVSGMLPVGSTSGQMNANYSSSGPTSGTSLPGRYPSQPQTSTYGNTTQNVTSAMNEMSLQNNSQRVFNLLQEKKLVPADGVEVPKPSLHHDFKKVNINPEIIRCTLNAVPQTSSLLNKARLPLGILIHPFKDLTQLPVIQSSVIVRCRSCRTYINPFVYFIDQRRWKCNLCYRVNELADEFSYDPVSKSYGEPQRRPEIRSATIEFIAPSEYMLRPPQPAVYLYVLDVSFNAIETGYLTVFCQTLLEELDKIPGDSRTQIGFICFDKALYFFNLAEGLSQPQMLIVPDIEDVFMPYPDSLLVNLKESKELISDLLNQLPMMFEGNYETSSSLGAALLSAFKLASPVGGRITVMQTQLPTSGPGALSEREDPNHGTSKSIPHLGPATDFYKKLALDCSAQQIAVDFFMLNGRYADLASVTCASKFSGGCIHYYPGFHTVKNPNMADKFECDLRRYLTRKIGFESVMRVRCTRGLNIHTFHGNFFVRSTDLLSLPNINPDAGFGMQMSIEDSLTESSTVCIQAALLYTSSKGERRIRVHTMCLPVTNQISEVISNADQQAIVGLLAKMAVDRTLTSSLGDAREALVNAAVDALGVCSQQVTSSQRVGTLPVFFTLRLLPMYILAVLKYLAFRVGSQTSLDERVYALHQCNVLPLCELMRTFYPALFPVHTVDDKNALKKEDLVVPQPPMLQLSAANLDRHGAYVLDAVDIIYLYVGASVSDQFCRDVFDVPNFASITDGVSDLPELQTEKSELIRNFINYLMDTRPFGATFLVVREDSKHRLKFFQHLIEDRTESSMSYYEFLQHLQKQVKS